MNFHHYSRYRSLDNDNPFLVMLTVILLAILVFVYTNDNIQEQRRASELSILQKAERQRQLEQEEKMLNSDSEKVVKQESEDDYKYEEEEKSFYQKLADGQDVSVLIVGDSIGAGNGASDYEHSFGSLLKVGLESKYKSQVQLNNISMGGNTSYAGYARTMTLSDDIYYDLVILCYGQNDELDNFDIYYESMIQAVKGRYPKVSIICVLESSQKEYTPKMQIISEIAEFYDLPVADMIAPFISNYKELVIDGIHPNDAGYKVYCDTLLNTIDLQVSNRRGCDLGNDLVRNELVHSFDKAIWLPEEKFVRVGNEFTLETQLTGSVLGIDYTFVSGSNSCRIYIDGVEFAAPEVNFDYDFSQRHIMIVNDWLNGEPIDVQDEIKIVFSEGEEGSQQADGFKGIIISG